VKVKYGHSTNSLGAAMKYMMISGSHSPLLDIVSPDYKRTKRVIGALESVRNRIEDFDPELVVLFGVDRSRDESSDCKPCFTIGVHAQNAGAEGTRNRISVPQVDAIMLAQSARRSGVDIAVSHDLEFENVLPKVPERLLGLLEKYPVIPVFVSCSESGLLSYEGARSAGEVIANFTRTLESYGRILFLGLGGLTHNPEILFPSIELGTESLQAYTLNKDSKFEMCREGWLDFDFDPHDAAIDILMDTALSDGDIGINEEWDRSFLDLYCKGDMRAFDSWKPSQIKDEVGLGAVETLSWVAAGAAISAVTNSVPATKFYQLTREIGLGFGIVETDVSEAVS